MKDILLSLARLVGWAMVFLGIVALGAALTAYPVMWIWNWIMPSLFGLPVIDIWHALGLSVLCNILFGSARTSTRTERR